MKLYTEKQVIEAISKAFTYSSNLAILKSLTPIELPSDEEIKKEMEYDEFDPYDVAYFGGLTYMRDLIQGGNNEQQ
tara:strand:+ start:2591 stop:2818 length:228 start_codon:yes stop_codon:yes gene_type:complete